MAEDRQVGPGLYVKLGLDYNGIIGGIGGVSLALNQTLDLFGKFENMAQGFIDLANNAGAMGKEIKDNARDLGLSVEQYQQWTHVAVAAGSSAEEITGSIRMMSVRIKEAADPTSAMGKQFAALGVSTVDANGKMRSMNDILLDLFPALNKLPEGFARNQAAQEIFGRNFSNIADLAGMSREQLQALIDQAPVFSDAKVAQLDAYNTQMNLLNEKMERTKALAGEEMMPAFSTWGNIIDSSLQKGQPLFVFFKDLNLALEMVAEGLTLLGARAIAVFDILNPLSGKFGNMDAFNKTISEADAAVSTMRSDFAKMEGGLVKDENGNWINPEFNSGDPSSSGYTPSASKAAALTATEIAQKEYNDLLKKANDWQSTGAKTIGEYQENLEKARLKVQNIQLDVQKLTEDLKKAGAATTGISTGLTYNQQFASSIQDGGVGPDAAGYSDIANMTADQLQEVVDKGSKGGSKGMAERAQTYLSLMKSKGTNPSGTAAPASATKSVSVADQATTDTGKLKTELSTQADLFGTLNDKITAGWITLEKSGLTHYTALAELSRIRAQAELDYMAACVNFGGTNPIVQNKIIMSKDGPDWTPAAFTAVTAPALVAAEFNKVAMLGASEKKASGETGGSGKTTVVNQITIKNDASVTSKVTTSMSDSMAQVIAVNGGTAGL